eukprot:XP_001694285.1 predicted protein [Chlamydomonas reinhardtii]
MRVTWKKSTTGGGLESFTYLTTVGEAFKQAHEHPTVMALALREIRTLQRTGLHGGSRWRGLGDGGVFPFVGRSAYRELYAHPQGLPPERLRLLVYQVLQALNYLHNRKICHRDLCDFGFARPTRCGPTEAERLSSYVFTRWYRSPEVLVGDLYGPAADIWSLGCTVAELAPTAAATALHRGYTATAPYGGGAAGGYQQPQQYAHPQYGVHQQQQQYGSQQYGMQQPYAAGGGGGAGMYGGAQGQPYGVHAGHMPRGNAPRAGLHVTPSCPHVFGPTGSPHGSNGSLGSFGSGSGGWAAAPTSSSGGATPSSTVRRETAILSRLGPGGGGGVRSGTAGSYPPQPPAAAQPPHVTRSLFGGRSRLSRVLSANSSSNGGAAATCESLPNAASGNGALSGSRGSGSIAEEASLHGHSVVCEGA